MFFPVYFTNAEIPYTQTINWKKMLNKKVLFGDLIDDSSLGDNLLEELLQRGEGGSQDIYEFFC